MKSVVAVRQYAEHNNSDVSNFKTSLIHFLAYFDDNDVVEFCIPLSFEAK